MTYFLMNTSKLFSRLLAVGTPALLARECLLGTAQLAHLRAIVARVLNLSPVATHQKALETHINTDCLLDWSSSTFFNLLLDHKGHVPTPIRLLHKCGALTFAKQGSMQSYPYQANLGDTHLCALKHHALRYSKACFIAFARLETRELGLFAEKLLKCLIQIAQGLLQQLTIYISKPSRLRLLLEQLEFSSQVIIAQRLLACGVVFSLACQPPIPNPTTRTRKLQQARCLLRAWFQSIAIGGLDRSHAKYFSTFVFVMRTACAILKYCSCGSPAIHPPA